MQTEIAVQQQQSAPVAVDLFINGPAFEHAQRVAKALASSDLVPESYKGNISNTLVALEVANRIGASPLMVMQNLNIIYGRPSWSSTFIISAINTCGRFSPLRFKMSGQGDGLTCVAVAHDKSGELLEGPPVSIAVAKKEGWYDKKGSKWPNMPELMLRYRAAAFFGRLYAPEVLMGMKSEDEILDVQYTEVPNHQAANFLQQPANISAEVEKINEAVETSAPSKRTRKKADAPVEQAVAEQQTDVAPQQPNQRDGDLM